MKRSIVTASLLMLTVTASLAQVGATTTTTTTTTGTTTDTAPTLWGSPRQWWDERFYYDANVDRGHLFSGNELTLDAFGTYLNPESHGIKSVFNRNVRHGRWGGGVGADYFWSRSLGLGADTSFQVDEKKFVDHVGGRLIARLPIDAIRLAPYVFGGGGYKFEPNDTWYVELGPGVEFRFNRNLGIFGDASYIFLDRVHAGTPRDELYFRAGLRVAF